MNTIDETIVKRHLLQCWSGKTSSSWTAANPTRGQCSVTCLVIQDHFGGEIIKTKLNDGRWHFYNRIDGQRYDFTRDQFEELIAYVDSVTSREEAFSDTDEAQYNCLSSAFKKALHAAVK